MSAVFIQSSQTATSASSTTVVVTKPVSLAVGDLMLSIVGLLFGGGGVLPVPPAGWSTLDSGALPSSNGNYGVFWKIADSTDVAATNFTFTRTPSGTPDAMVANITRITGHNVSAPFDQYQTIGSSALSGITPTVSMGLFVMSFIGVNTTSTAGSVSGYTITNNNPTWTESFDIGQPVAGSERLGLALATANQTRITATGTGSLVPVSYNSGQMMLFNIIPQPLTPMNATFTMPTITIPYGAAVLAILSTLNIPTASNIAQKWNNAVKHASTWINRNKS